MKLPYPVRLAKSELVRRVTNGVREAVRKAPDNAREAWRTWKRKREASG